MQPSVLAIATRAGARASELAPCLRARCCLDIKGPLALLPAPTELPRLRLFGQRGPETVLPACCLRLRLRCAPASGLPITLPPPLSSRAQKGMAGGGWVWFPRNPFLRELGVSEPVEDVVALMTAWAKTSNAGPGDDHGPGVDALDLELIEAFARESEGVITALVENKLYNCAPTEIRDDEDRRKNAALLRRKLDESPAAAARAGLTPAAFEALSSYIPSYCSEHPLDVVPTGKPVGLTN